MENHLWYLDDDGGDHWYSAESADEAIALYLDDKGEAGNVKAELLPDDEDFTVNHPDEFGQSKETRKAKDWCEHKGFVCTSEY